MHRIFVALTTFISVVFFCSPSFSFGILEFCSTDPTTFSTANNESTIQEAQTRAHKTLGFCKGPTHSHFFSDQCIAFLLSPPLGPSGGRNFVIRIERTEEE